LRASVSGAADGGRSHYESPRRLTGPRPRGFCTTPTRRA